MSSVIYDSGSVLRKAIFSPHETSPHTSPPFISQNVVLESQLPHKIVNLLVKVYDKLTILWGVDFPIKQAAQRRDVAALALDFRYLVDIDHHTSTATMRFSLASDEEVYSVCFFRMHGICRLSSIHNIRIDFSYLV